MSVEELQSIGSGDDRSRESSLASLADDLTKRSSFHHRLGFGLDRALAHLHGKLDGDGVPTAASPAAAANESGGSQFLSTAAATASGAASGFGSFRVPIQKENDGADRKLSSLAEGAGDAEDDRGQQGQPPAAAVSDAPILQVCVMIAYLFRVRSSSSQRHQHVFNQHTRLSGG